MAQFLSKTLIRAATSSPSSTSSFLFSKSPSSGLSLSPRVLTHRHRSNQSGKAQQIEVGLDSSDNDVDVLGIRKLEEVIHSIIVKLSAPDWLPFIPGSSYWVPPRRQSVLEVVGKLANQMTEDEAMSLAAVRGWPSSAYFLKGTAPTQLVPMEVEVEVKVHRDGEDTSQSEDEEG